METYQMGKGLESINPEGVVFHSPGCRAAATWAAARPNSSTLYPATQGSRSRQPWAVEYNPFGVNAIDLVRFILPLALSSRTLTRTTGVMNIAVYLPVGSETWSWPRHVWRSVPALPGRSHPGHRQALRGRSPGRRRLVRSFLSHPHEHWDGGVCSVARQLRRQRIDLAVLLPNSFRSALAVRLGGANRPSATRATADPFCLPTPSPPSVTPPDA